MAREGDEWGLVPEGSELWESDFVEREEGDGCPRLP